MKSWIRCMMAMLCLLAVAAPASAWSRLGHALVGDLAELELSPAARRQVGQLLKGESEPTLGGIAAWADALRYEDAERFRATSRWHYVNARGGGCDFDVARDCPDGQCIIAAILEQERILQDTAQPLEARRDALKFLVHLMGDLHQPLHAGPREDRGGNGFQVSLRARLQPDEHERGEARGGVRGTNLHVVWDHYVLASARLDRRQYFARLKSRMQTRPAHGHQATALSWARESCRLVGSQRLYPSTHQVDQAWLDANRGFAEGRIVSAAGRLAAVLNRALDEPPAQDQGNRSRNR